MTTHTDGDTYRWYWMLATVITTATMMTMALCFDEGLVDVIVLRLICLCANQSSSAYMPSGTSSPPEPISTSLLSSHSHQHHHRHHCFHVGHGSTVITHSTPLMEVHVSSVTHEGEESRHVWNSHTRSGGIMFALLRLDVRL